MRVLVLGGGAREHALAWKLAQGAPRTEVLCAPGNPGIARLARCLPVDPAEPDAVLKLARAEAVDLTLVGPELPLQHGVADLFARHGARLLGPARAAAQLECSKVFAKDFMRRHGVPTAAYRVCDSADEALAVVRGGDLGFPIVVKADGLAAGKGVTVAADAEEGAAAVRAAMVERRFGEAGARVVLEECLAGEEVSFFALCDGRGALPLGSAQDHKRAYEGDRGPNTGGMGAFAPSPLVDPALQARIMREIVEPVLQGMRHEGHAYRGFLYAGLMLTADGPRVIEFNVRLGDPEAQVLLPSIDGDLLPMLVAAASGGLDRLTCAFRPEPHVGVVLASGGYPGAFETGKPIEGLAEAEALPGVTVFHAGTALQDGRLVTAGGRVLTVVASGGGYREAIDRAYEAASRIRFEGMYLRGDIGLKALRGNRPA